MKPRLRFKEYQDDWRQERLSQAAKVTMGQSPLSNNYTDNPSDNLLIQGNADLANGKIAPRLYTKTVTKLSHRGDTILTVRAPVGAVAVNNYGTAVIGRGVANLAKNAFVRFWLEHFRNAKGWLRYSTGSTFNSINSKIIKNLPLACPDVSEQRQIGHFFNILDKLIHLQRNKLELLRKLKLGYIQKMFPRKNEIQPRIRFDGFQDNWKEVTLGDVAQFVNGKAFRQKDLLDKGKYPVIRVGNFYTDRKIYYSNQELASKYYINNGDLLYTWSATFGPHIWHGNKSIYHYHIWKVICRKIYKSFLLQLLNVDKSHMTHNGSTMAHLTKYGMENKLIKVPSLPEQQRIGSFFNRLDQRINLQQNELYYLRLLKKAYLQKMFC